ncbi:MAG: RNA methyltransferase [Candidatus Palauibacterales bacterium]|nr:RNA methyltransferase [Candidatus Palauibacterales bacterium]
MPSLNQSKHVRALHRRKERRARGEFLVEGPRVLAELLRAGRPVTLVLYTEAAVAEPDGRRLLRELLASGIATEEVSDGELREHADTVTPQGWLATAPIPSWEWSRVDGARLLVLDSVRDPGNAGTLIRAADALGANAVVVLPGTADPWSPKVTRSAAGSSVRLPIFETEWRPFLERLEGSETEVWVAAADGDRLDRAVSPPPRVALVVGNEGEGVSEAIRDAADRVVAIPMRREVESLNAAVAGAILMDRLFGG